MTRLRTSFLNLQLALASWWIVSVLEKLAPHYPRPVLLASAAVGLIYEAGQQIDRDMPDAN